MKLKRHQARKDREPVTQPDFLSFQEPIPLGVKNWEGIWDPHYKNLSSIKRRLKTVTAEEALPLLHALCQKKLGTGEELQRVGERLHLELEAFIDALLSTPKTTANEIDGTTQARQFVDTLERIACFYTRSDFLRLDIELLQDLIDRHGVSLASGSVILSDYNLGLLKILRQQMPLLLANEKLFMRKIFSAAADSASTQKLKGQLDKLDKLYQDQVSDILMGAQMRGKQLQGKHKATLRAEVEDLAREVSHPVIIAGKPFRPISTPGEIMKWAKYDALWMNMDWITHIDPETGIIPLTQEKVDWFERLLDKAISDLRRKQRASQPLLSPIDLSELDFLADPALSPAEAYLEAFICESLLAQLPQDTRSIIELIAQGYTAAEIAEKMKLTVDQVNGRIKRTRKKPPAKENEK